MKFKKSLFIATSSFGINRRSTLDLLKRNKINFKLNPLKRKLNADELMKLAKDSTHIIAGTEIYDKKVLNNLKKLKFIFRLGSGIENLDLKDLKKRKIKTIKSKVTPEIAVAELIVGMSLSLLRDLHRHNSNMKNKIWIKKMGNTIQNKNRREERRGGDTDAGERAAEFALGFIVARVSSAGESSTRGLGVGEWGDAVRGAPLVRRVPERPVGHGVRRVELDVRARIRGGALLPEPTLDGDAVVGVPRLGEDHGVGEELLGRGETREGVRFFRRGTEGGAGLGVTRVASSG